MVKHKDKEDKDDHIVWLASYPKSGNTWFRVLMANLFNDNEEPVSINDIPASTISSNRNIFDQLTGIEASDLPLDEVEALRPEVYKQFADNQQKTLFIKTHDAYTYTKEGQPLFPNYKTRGAIYLIRNPLDVAISFAHHSNMAIGKMIEKMLDQEHGLCRNPNKLHNQLEQKLLTWDQHVRSWTEQENIPVKVIRYEDMVADIRKSIKDALSFLNLDTDNDKIEEAIRLSSLENLQKQEQEKGFREKTPKSASFFRKGQPGEWKNVLSNEQIKQIRNKFAATMNKYDY